MCSAYDVGDRRHYTRNCTTVTKTDPNRDRSWTSLDLRGEYDGKCTYYDRYRPALFITDAVCVYKALFAISTHTLHPFPAFLFLSAVA
jgi:hypothetical protein